MKKTPKYPDSFILLVDDEKAILRLLRRVLQANGFRRIETCSDSRRVIDLLQQGYYDLLVLDLNMPKVRGEEILAWVRANRPGLSVIVLTAEVDVKTAVRCMKAGAADYLLKPVENTELVEVVNRVIDAAHEPAVRYDLTETQTASLRSQDFQVTPDQVIGDCRLLDKIGAGSSGVVFRAHHTALARDVAIKLLPMDVIDGDPRHADRFLREVRTAKRIRNRNVVSIIADGKEQGQYYLIMEYAPGGSVLDRMKRCGGPLPVPECIRLMDEVARGLQVAHEMGIVHRDIKPANILYGEDGLLKIADLGLAKRWRSQTEIGDPTDSAVMDQITIMGGMEDSLMGTPPYIAPEMIADPENFDTRVDLYSLGVTAYQCLTMKLPICGKTPVETILRQVSDIPQPPETHNPAVPANLSAIVMKLLEKDPADRYQTPRELLDALRNLP